MAPLSKELRALSKWRGVTPSGKVTHVVGLLIESTGPSVHLGELCYIYNRQGTPLPCEVVGFKEDKVMLMSIGEMYEIAPGAEVYPSGKMHLIPVSEHLCGRVLDALGNPIDGKGPIEAERYYPSIAPPPRPLERQIIRKLMVTGVKAIDALCTIGQGQRMGIFSGAGVGKSTLLSMIAKSSQAEINVIALVGERGREVREFVERNLGKRGLDRSIIIVATSDQAALLRAKAPQTAMAIAEYFRDRGQNVMFMMDSISRYATALREIGLAIGEPPTTRGYTPSVFANLPKLLERAGNNQNGSITGFYTILVEGDDINEPISDQVRAILDGHLVLSRKLASAGHFPAIEILESLSRVMLSITDQEHQYLAKKMHQLLQSYHEAEDLINVGAYVSGSNPYIDEAKRRIGGIRKFLQQRPNEVFDYEETLKLLRECITR